MPSITARWMQKRQLSPCTYYKRSTKCTNMEFSKCCNHWVKHWENVTATLVATGWSGAHPAKGWAPANCASYSPRRPSYTCMRVAKAATYQSNRRHSRTWRVCTRHFRWPEPDVVVWRHTGRSHSDRSVQSQWRWRCGCARGDPRLQTWIG